MAKQQQQREHEQERQRAVSPWLALLLIPVAAVIYLALARSAAQDEGRSKRGEPRPLAATVVAAPLTDDEAPALAEALARAWAGEVVAPEELPPRLRERAQPIYVGFRRGGALVHELWRVPEGFDPEHRGGRGETTWTLLTAALEDGRRSLGATAEQVDRLELDLSHDFRRLDWSDERLRGQLLDGDRNHTPVQQGVRGVMVEHGERRALLAPTWQLAANRSTADWLKTLREQWGLGEDELAAARIHSFEAEQILLALDRSPARATLMFRGNELVEIDAVDRASTQALAEGMAAWLIANVDADGRMTYHYLPSEAREAGDNNMVRQWMASAALIRWAAARDDPALFELAARNLDYNLAHYFHYETVDGEELGVVEWQRQSKLGAIALAGMALSLHPRHQRWAREIAALRRTVDRLYHDEDGSFASFYRGPDQRVDNFYPGEAMLWWATIYAEAPDPELLRRYRRAFEYYRRWHLDPGNRHPAFVPWHLQANFALWSALGPEQAAFKQELVEFCFEIADWLVATQQWTREQGLRYPDERGRFYVPSQRYGVPHASSTGVYIEGLIDAWQLARAVGDEVRRERYRLALLRALRSIMQLQFVDDVDMYYVAIEDRARVRGGIRTAVFDNRVRCDNVQHPLIGISKLLQLFAASEYEHPGR